MLGVLFESHSSYSFYACRSSLRQFCQSNFANIVIRGVLSTFFFMSGIKIAFVFLTFFGEAFCINEQGASAGRQASANQKETTARCGFPKIIGFIRHTFNLPFNQTQAVKAMLAELDFFSLIILVLFCMVCVYPVCCRASSFRWKLFCLW